MCRSSQGKYCFHIPYEEAVCRFFDPRGILFFETLEGLTRLLVCLSADDYHDRMDAVRENFGRCHDYLATPPHHRQFDV